ncbi:hypothetical protein K1719_026521 [Acacia pycnantha]|nr:hypothetical protein K1719_026521 [Acacia pycnantha]
MEMGSAQQFLKGKTVLVTGATGFLAKVLLEKLLRIQSDLKKLYLLLRASDANAATKRLHDEIISKDLFRVLRDKWGSDFGSFISEKVVAVAGDVSLANLGLNEENAENEISKEIDIIVNVAATTNFDERFDIAIGVNTMGARNVLNFAKTCPKIQALLHVSTAYVCGEAKVDGKVIKEEPFQMGQTLNGVTKLDIEEENILLEKRLEELRAKNVDGNALKFAMKDYGIERAKLHGWPNTYSFTKAMGEMILSHLKNNIPLIIVRPTIVSSTFKEPFPGWIEGFRTIDSVIGGYGKGMVTHFLGRPRTIVDVIPVDMVINSMIAALKLIIHSKNGAHQQENYIYHIGSSFRNPLTMSRISNLSYLYFSKNPLTQKNGKPIIVSKAKFLTSLHSFQRHMMIRYLLPLKGLNLVNKVCCLNFFQDVYRSRLRKVQKVIRMAEIYEPYLVFKASFNDANTESLRRTTKMENAGDVGFDFEFDPLSIDWTDYMINVHIPGFIKFAMK